MTPDSKDRVTEILQAMTGDGDGEDARATPDELLPLVYNELRRLAQSYLSGRNQQSLQATEIVHEAFVRLVNAPSSDWNGRSHFFAAAATAMRHMLVDHARRKGREKHGAHRQQVTFSDVLFQNQDSPSIDLDQLLDLSAALERLAVLNERQAKVVEMRYFGGLKVPDVAAVLDVSSRSVEGDWTIAKAWLRRELAGGRAR
jgi:RNA polymerase sigma factor (TIGR02999 family)